MDGIEKKIHEEIIVACFGGQGVMLLGKLLSYAAMYKELHVTYLPSYGAEVRGGTAHCNIIISNEPIASPIIQNPNTIIVMNNPSLEKFEERVQPKGALLYNSSLVLRKPIRKDIYTKEIPATEIANELGNTQVANSVMLGAYTKLNEIFTINEIEEAFKKTLPKHKSHLLEINKVAIKKGFNY